MTIKQFAKKIFGNYRGLLTLQLNKNTEPERFAEDMIRKQGYDEFDTDVIMQEFMALLYKAGKKTKNKKRK